MNAAEFIPCSLRSLPEDLQVRAAEEARRINPSNTPRLDRLIEFLQTIKAWKLKRNESIAGLETQAAAVMTTKYWGRGGVRLGVAFLDNAAADLKRRILNHMNAWADKGRSNVTFAEASRGAAEVRISRASGGYWSYLGTDIKMVPSNQQTMNLQSFSMSTPESEFVRVVRHETGHTLGFPHEHLREDIVSQLDYQKTIAYFRSTQGWSEQQTVQNVLTPVEERYLIATPTADEDSIMCYQLPGSITKDGQPILGGDDINQTDRDFCAGIYPGQEVPPEPPVEPPVGPAEQVVVIPGKRTVVIPASWMAFKES